MHCIVFLINNALSGIKTDVRNKKCICCDYILLLMCNVIKIMRTVYYFTK